MNDSPLTSIIESAIHDALDTLDLHGLGLTELPSLPSELLSLRRLDLSGNRLQAVPDEVFRLMQLDELNLADNGIAQLDPKIGTLHALRSLDLSENRLTMLPPELAGCTNLDTLSLFGNQISTLPEVVLELAGLRSLDLARNRLDTLPSLHNLVNLEVLDVAGNELSKLSHGFAALEELRALDLSGNQLTFIGPGDVPASLRQLILDDNHLTEIPTSLLAIEHLSVRGNPIAQHPNFIPRTHAVRELVTGGYAFGVRYFEPPKRQFNFALRVDSKESVVDSLNVYFKSFEGTPAVVRLEDGSRLDLTLCGRQAALHMAEPSTRVQFDFSPTSNATTVEMTCEFVNRVLDRVCDS